MPIFAASISEEGNECRKRKIANAQRHAGILHHVVAAQRGCLCFGHHPTAEGGAPDCGGGNTLSAPDPTEKRRVAELRMGGIDAGTSAEVLQADGKGGGFSA